MASSVIAIAGGSGGVGRTIADELLRNGRYEVIILARNGNSNLAAEIGAPILAVDYADSSATQDVLEQHNADTLICTFNTMGDATPELNLIAAANSSSTVRRYIPSVFGIPYTDPSFASWFPVAQGKLDVIAALEASNLEFSTWYVGYFIDYCLRPRMQSHVEFVKMVLDIEHDKAAIPGTGNEPFVLIHTHDLAKFVVASLGQPKWDKETYLVGERTSFNQLVSIIEEVKSTKLDILYDDLQDVEKGIVTELPMHEAFYESWGKDQTKYLAAVFSRLFATGFCDLPRDRRTINEDFPQIKARAVREQFEKAWGSK